MTAAGDWQERLRLLHNDIWQEHSQKPGAHPAYRHWSSERRTLTLEEWGQLQSIIREHSPACLMRNACMGFGCAMDVLEPPLCPGAPPEMLISITCRHLPPEIVADGSEKEIQRTSGLPGRFGDGWRLFRPHTHNDENAQLLVFCGLELPRQKEYYDY